MKPTASLTERLGVCKAGFVPRTAPGRVAMMTPPQPIFAPAASDSGRRRWAPLCPSCRCSMPWASVRLSAQWQPGSMVLIFDRGGWCSICNLGLRVWQLQLAAQDARLPDAR